MKERSHEVKKDKKHLPQCRIQHCEFISVYRGYCKAHGKEFPAYHPNTVCAAKDCSTLFYRGCKPRFYCDDHIHMPNRPNAVLSKRGVASVSSFLLENPSNTLPPPGAALAKLVEITKTKQRRCARLAKKGMVAPSWSLL